MTDYTSTDYSLIEIYLSEFGGSVRFYRQYLSEGQRLGQAFFNSLIDSDKSKLSGTSHDPFHKNDKASIYDAIDFLTRPTKGSL